MILRLLIILPLILSPSLFFVLCGVFRVEKANKKLLVMTIVFFCIGIWMLAYTPPMGIKDGQSMKLYPVVELEEDYTEEFAVLIRDEIIFVADHEQGKKLYEIRHENVFVKNTDEEEPRVILLNNEILTDNKFINFFYSYKERKEVGYKLVLPKENRLYNVN